MTAAAWRVVVPRLLARRTSSRPRSSTTRTLLAGRPEQRRRPRVPMPMQLSCVFEKIDAPSVRTSATAARRADRRVAVVVVLVASARPSSRADASAVSTLPVFAAIRAGALPARVVLAHLLAQVARRRQRSGVSAHFTLSCAAAWIASYSVGATTPRKSPLRTTCAPGMCLIELSSTETASRFVPSPYAPWPRGRTTRPCSIPGTRMFCDVGVLAGRPCPGCRSAATRCVPTSLYCADRLRRRDCPASSVAAGDRDVEAACRRSAAP